MAHYQYMLRPGVLHPRVQDAIRAHILPHFTPEQAEDIGHVLSEKAIVLDPKGSVKPVVDSLKLIGTQGLPRVAPQARAKLVYSILNLGDQKAISAPVTLRRLKNLKSFLRVSDHPEYHSAIASIASNLKGRRTIQAIQRALRVLPAHAHADFFQRGLVRSLYLNRPDLELNAKLDQAQTLLRQVPTKAAAEFIARNLSYIPDNRPDLVPVLRRLAGAFPLDRREYYESALLGRLNKIVLTPKQADEQSKIVRDYLHSMPRWMYTDLAVQNFGHLVPPGSSDFRRYELDKRGYFGKGFVRTRVLGGKRWPVLIREMPAESYAHWQRAVDLGIPAEPILRKKNGKPRVSFFNAKDGTRMARIFCEYAGRNVNEFLNAHPEHIAEVERQVANINQELTRHGIHHGDNMVYALNQPKFDNYVVRTEGDKLVVRLIDWDRAAEDELR